MNAILAAIKRSPKLSVLVAAVASALIVPAVLLAYGPDRPTFTMQAPADHITFNSITDNPNIGDERNFVTIRETGTTGAWQDDQNVVAGKSYTVRMYVHNNAASNLNLVAQNVKAEFNLPNTNGKDINVTGFINSTNASPTQVYDHASFHANDTFNLTYTPGTLKYQNNVFGIAGTPLSESIFTTAGAKLGYDKLDGNIPGCLQYAGYLTFQVTPKFATNFEVTKQVKKTGTTGWQKSVAVNLGDSVDYLISYKNTSAGNEDDVLVQDALPAGISYVPGSTSLTNAAHPTPLTLSNNLTNGTGINIGGYTAGSNAYVKFSAKVNDPSLICGTKTYTNKARVIVNSGAKEDSADVTVTKVCQPGQTPQELPTTGIDAGVMTFVGLGITTAAAAYAVTSTRVRNLFRG